MIWSWLKLIKKQAGLVLIYYAGMDISSTRTDLIRRGEGLEYFTILWNSVEGLLAVGTGIAAGSISLVGFASDRLCAFPFAQKCTGTEPVGHCHRGCGSLRDAATCTR